MSSEKEVSAGLVYLGARWVERGQVVPTIVADVCEILSCDAVLYLDAAILHSY